MSKLNCPCGNQMSNVSCPSSVEATLVTDWDADNICVLEDTEEMVDAIQDCRGMWECPECGRLGFNYPKRGDNRFKWYVPEDGKPGHLCESKYDAASPDYVAPKESLFVRAQRYKNIIKQAPDGTYIALTPEIVECRGVGATVQQAYGALLSSIAEVLKRDDEDMEGGA